MREITEETTIPTIQPRRRSNSLPIPQIEISLYQGTNSRDSPSNSSLIKDYIDIPEQASATLLADSTFQNSKQEKSEDAISMGAGGRRPSEKKKKVKMADLRTLIETKILSKSDKGIEKIGLDVSNGHNGKRLQHAVN